MAWDWPKVSALAALTVLAISLWVNFLSPFLRKRRLKKPVEAYFHVKALNKGNLGWVIQDDIDHNVKEICLPANAIVEIEVAYYPKISFNVDETVFQCEGEFELKPTVEEPLRPFVLRGDFKEAEFYWNRHGGFHYASRYRSRAADSCYTKGFRLRTRAPGVYKTWLGFLTDGQDCDAKDLVIRVEEKPKTRMPCSSHTGCNLRPVKLTT